MNLSISERVSLWLLLLLIGTMTIFNLMALTSMHGEFPISPDYIALGFATIISVLTTLGLFSTPIDGFVNDWSNGRKWQ